MTQTTRNPSLHSKIKAFIIYPKYIVGTDNGNPFFCIFLYVIAAPHSGRNNNSGIQFLFRVIDLKAPKTSKQRQ